MGKDFRAFDHGTSHIDLKFATIGVEMLPVELHHKADGSLNGEPSFCIVMTNDVISVYGQVSLKMLSEALNELGYKIEKY